MRVLAWWLLLDTWDPRSCADCACYRFLIQSLVLNMTVHSAAQSLDVFLPAFLPQVIHPGFHAFALLQVETEGGSLK